MKKGIVCVFIVVVFGVFIYAAFRIWNEKNQDSNQSLPVSGMIITPNNSKILIRFADNPRERELGLSYFSHLPAQQGMLFLFEKPGKYLFWMKDMNFPIDMVWLRKIDIDKFEVVYIAENVDPSTYPQSFGPDADADAVLEIGAFQARAGAIVPGGSALQLVKNITMKGGLIW